MELFAERDLRHLLPQYEGWTIEPVDLHKIPGCFYRVSRCKWVGTEVAFIAVSLDPTPGDLLLQTLDTLPEGRGSITSKYLLTPKGTDTAAVPPTVKILLMTSFAFVDGELVWLSKKKFSRRYSPEPAPAPAESTPVMATPSPSSP
jgi:hypothetical protein